MGGVKREGREHAGRGTRKPHRLQKEKTAHSNRIKALLRRQGIAVGNPRQRDWLGWLAAQRGWQGQPVPPRILAEIEHEHARLLLVRNQLDALAQPPVPANLTPAAAEMGKRSALLLRLKCRGPAFATTRTTGVLCKD